MTPTTSQKATSLQVPARMKAQKKLKLRRGRAESSKLSTTPMMSQKPQSPTNLSQPRKSKNPKLKTWMFPKIFCTQNLLTPPKLSSLTSPTIYSESKRTKRNPSRKLVRIFHTSNGQHPVMFLSFQPISPSPSQACPRKCKRTGSPRSAMRLSHRSSRTI